MRLLDFIPHGPVSLSLLAITALVFAVCWVRGSNRLAISAILLAMPLHTFNIYNLQIPWLHVAIDLVTAFIVILAFTGRDRLIQATFWTVVIAVQTLVLLDVLSLFWGGVATKLIILAATILCLPTGGGSRVRARSIHADFKGAGGGFLNLVFRVAADKIRRAIRDIAAD